MKNAKILLTIVILAVVANVASACPTCKDGIAENDPAQQALSAGFYYSILFMMSMPFVILGTFGSFAYFSIKKAREQQPSELPEGDSGQ